MNPKKITRPVATKIVSGVVKSGTQSQGGQTINAPQGNVYDDTYSTTSGGLIRAGIT